MVSNIIFIGGIHGCGKTTMCKKMYNETKLNHYICSQLIKELDSSAIIGSSKKVKDINKNQNILLEALNKKNNDESILLDGHFCLIDYTESIKRIPIDMFVKLPISLIVVVTRNPKDIALSISHRDNRIFNQKFLDKFQEEELCYAKIVAKLLGVEFIEYKGDESLNNLIKLIQYKTGKQ